MKYLLLLFIFSLKIQTAHSEEFNVNLNENETKEQVARSLNLNAQQIEIYPIEVQYIANKLRNENSIGVKGKIFITWGVRDIFLNEEEFNYKKDNVNFKNDSTLEGTQKGDLVNAFKVGYQITNNLQVDASYNKTSSSMNLSTLNDGLIIGNISGILPLSIENEFTTIKIGLVANMNLIQAKSWRMDLLIGGNAGLVRLDSTLGNGNEMYSDLFGYAYGAEAGVRVIHKSGFHIQAGAGVNQKTIAPKKYEDGSETSIDGTEGYVFVGVGYTFGKSKK